MKFKDIEGFAKEWGVLLPEVGEWTELLPLFERICEKKEGYFIFKYDGERSVHKYTFVINIPYPIDIVLRKDTDDIEAGVLFLARKLRDEGGAKAE